MKNVSRFTFAAALMLLFGACTTGESVSPNNENPMIEQTVLSHRVTLDEAIGRAQRFLAENASSTRSADLRLKNYRIYNAKPATRTDADGSDTEFYILNFENDGGYAIVAADDRATDIYAFAYEGNIDIDEAMENPGFCIFMDGAAEYYDCEVGEIDIKRNPDNMKPFDPIGGGSGSGGSGGGGSNGSGEGVTKYMITYLDGVPYHTKIEDFKTTHSVAPKTITKWGQDIPYNKKCFTSSGAQAAAGCAPIAMAQIMAYYEYPKSCGNYTLDWDAIKTDDCVYSNTEEADAVAALIARIGKFANTKYGVSASSTNTKMIKPAFVTFGYKTGSLQNYSADAAMGSLKKMNSCI